MERQVYMVVLNAVYSEKWKKTYLSGIEYDEKFKKSSLFERLPVEGKIDDKYVSVIDLADWDNSRVIILKPDMEFRKGFDGKYTASVVNLDIYNKLNADDIV